MPRRALIVLAASLCLAAPAAAAPDTAMRIAVMEFQSGGATGGDLESLGKGLQSMITTDLAQVAAFQLVERQRLRDIEGEIKLSRSALVDKATAVKIGKLAGATHLVTGTFTVVGDKMRLDTRVFGVADGRVVLAEQIDGDKDAFFELEKSLVGKLIAAVGVKLQPKERAQVAKVHTADFEAFRKYSQGVELFDEQKYDEALAALRDAQNRDAGFQLAAVTLAEYERVIGELRTKADAIEAAQAQMERLKQDKGVRDEVEMVEKLYALSTKKDAQPVERLAALHALALIYGTNDGHGHHEKLSKVQDEFAMQRTAETLWRSYFAESSRVFPEVTLSPSIENDNGIPMPATFDKDFADLEKRIREFSAGGFNHQESLLYFDLDHVQELARRLLLDGRQEVDLRAKVLELGAKVNAPDKWRRDTQLSLAKALRAIGEYGKSTALFGRLGAGEKEPMRLEELAREIEENRELEKALAAAKLTKLAAELLIMMPNTWSDDVQAEIKPRLATLAKPGAWELHLLTRARRFHDERAYVIVDGEPAWQVRGSDEVLATGPRSEILRGSGLRYYRPAKGGRDAFVVIGGVPRKDVEARFTLSYGPPEDWWPGTDNPGRGSSTPASARKVDPGRPQVAFAFGVRDVQAEGRPMRSLELLVGDKAVRLCEVTQADASEPPKVKVLEEQAVDLAGQAQVEVTVKVAGGTVAATVGGKSLSFKAPEDRTGFQGLAFRGSGYAGVDKLKLGKK